MKMAAIIFIGFKLSFPFKSAKPEAINSYISALEKRNIVVNVRRSRGKDIDAACGQLANKS